MPYLLRFCLLCVLTIAAFAGGVDQNEWQLNPPAAIQHNYHFAVVQLGPGIPNGGLAINGNKTGFAAYMNAQGFIAPGTTLTFDYDSSYQTQGGVDNPIYFNIVSGWFNQPNKTIFTFKNKMSTGLPPGIKYKDHYHVFMIPPANWVQESFEVHLSYRIPTSQTIQYGWVWEGKDNATWTTRDKSTGGAGIGAAIFKTSKLGVELPTSGPAVMRGVLYRAIGGGTPIPIGTFAVTEGVILEISDNFPDPEEGEDPTPTTTPPDRTDGAGTDPDPEHPPDTKPVSPTASGGTTPAQGGSGAGTGAGAGTGPTGGDTAAPGLTLPDGFQEPTDYAAEAADIAGKQDDYKTAVTQALAGVDTAYNSAGAGIENATTINSSNLPTIIGGWNGVFVGTVAGSPFVVDLSWMAQGFAFLRAILSGAVVVAFWRIEYKLISQAYNVG